MIINVEEVKLFVSQNVSQLRKPEEVASSLNFPVARLKRLFQRKEKQSLSKFIRITRITRMKELLQNSEKQCKVICLETGLREDVGARLFKNATGITMENYRRLCRHDGPTLLRPVLSKPETPKAAQRLVLTEKIIREMIATGENRSKSSPRRVPGILVQGPAH